MTDIPTPQSPPDARQVMRSIGPDGTVAFSQVGFQEIDFGAVFGGKTTSSTEETIGYGVKTFTLDEDDGKISVGNTLQITSLDDVTCFMYGVVVAKDATASPAQITVYIHTISNLTGTFTNWEIQIVEVSRDITAEVGDEDFTAEDHHRVLFYKTPLTAPRTLTLSSGETLIPGARILVTNGDFDVGAFSSTNFLTINGSGEVLSFYSDFVEYVWTGSIWIAYNQGGVQVTVEAGSTPYNAIEFDDTAAIGPYFMAWKNSASPTAGDGIGAYTYFGNNSAGEATMYVRTYGSIIDPTDGAEEGLLNISTMVGGVLENKLFIGRGISTPSATGGDPGDDKINAKDYQIDGVPLSTSFQPKDPTLTALEAIGTNGGVSS